MTITYTNASGESLTLRQRRPYSLQRADRTVIHQSVAIISLTALSEKEKAREG